LLCRQPLDFDSFVYILVASLLISISLFICLFANQAATVLSQRRFSLVSSSWAWWPFIMGHNHVG
jgi:hypothetical protein